MKVYVYAIAKNEEKFVSRWFNCMNEADALFVLDTGSTDETVAKLKNLGVNTEVKQYKNFRFDIARNDALKLVPKDADICICTDLDEIFESGWRKKLEKQWKQNVNMLGKCKMVWNHLSNGENGVTYYVEKIHSRNNFSWIYPVHEILAYTGNTPLTRTTFTDVVIHHYPDSTKSRSIYLPLLQQAVKERPQDDRSWHYLAREYMFYGEYKKSINAFKKHLSLTNAKWADERCASLRYMANCYNKLNSKFVAIKYLKLACIEAPYLREPFLELANLYYCDRKYIDAIFVLKFMLTIKENSNSYISMPNCWNEYPYDLISICYYYLHNYTQALNYTCKALEINCQNERLQQNKIIYESLIKNQQK